MEKLKQNPIVSISILLLCHLFGLTCLRESTAVARSLGYGGNRARLIHKPRVSSLVMTEEKGGPNLAAFVPLKLLMMQSSEIYMERDWAAVKIWCYREEKHFSITYNDSNRQYFL